MLKKPAMLRFLILSLLCGGFFLLGGCGTVSRFGRDHTTPTGIVTGTLVISGDSLTASTGRSAFLQGRCGEEHTVTIGPSGSFSISGVPSGNWTFGIKVVQGTRIYLASVPTQDIPASATTNVGTVTLAQCGAIQGKVSCNAALDSGTVDIVFSDLSQTYRYFIADSFVLSAESTIATQPTLLDFTLLAPPGTLNFTVTPSGKSHHTTVNFTPISLTGVTISSGVTTNIGTLNGVRL